MSNHNYPHAFVSIHNMGEEHKEWLESIPGIRYRQWKDKYLVPHHALVLLDTFLKKNNLPFLAQWGVPKTEAKEWTYYKDFLDETELHSWVLDGFLTEFQSDAIVKTGHLYGCHLWHPTGAGKTLSAILWSLLHDGPILVVTRAASRVQYGREFERFTTLRPFVVRPIKKKNQKTLTDYLMEESEERKVVIVAWESITIHLEALENLAVQGASVIFDESHRGKSSKRWQSLPIPSWDEQGSFESYKKHHRREAKKLGGFIPKDQFEIMMIPTQNRTSAASTISKASFRVVCTTATPIDDRVRDLWGQLDLAEPFSWGSASVFKKRYCDAHYNFWGHLDTTGTSNLAELKERLTHSTHRIDYRETHRQLPAKRRQSFFITVEDQNRATGGFAAAKREAKKVSQEVLLETLLAESASKKRKAVLELVADHMQSNHKVVIFTGRKRDVDDIAKDIRKHKLIKELKTTVWSAHGDNSTQERQGIVDAYMKHDGKGGCVLIGTGDSFGESINLQDTDAALFVQLPYTPGRIRQWEGRFCRLGQKRPVVIYYCVAENTVDERIADILLSKMDAVEKVAEDFELAESRYAIGNVTREEIIEHAFSSDRKRP